MPNGSGMGNPHEDRFFNESFRDYGQDDPRQEEVVYDPRKCRTPGQGLSPEMKALLDEAECRIERGLKKAVFISKRPSFVEPPFFSKPITKTRGVTLAPALPTQIFNRVIEDRQRAVVATIGIDTDNPTAYNLQQLAFWFALSDPVRGILPIFDDQTIGLAFAPAGLTSGFTTIMPGTTENPFSMLKNGVAFQVKGRQTLLFMGQNFTAPAVPVIVRAVMSYYQYWLPQADAFASADLQL